MFNDKRDAFIRERQYVHGLTAKSIQWHRTSLGFLRNDSPSQDDLTDALQRLRSVRNVVGTNTALRSIKAYLRWAGSSVKVPHLREPVTIMETFSDRQVRKLVTFKPATPGQREIWLLALFLLDTGARITEALTVTVGSVDLDNLLVRLQGKGGRERLAEMVAFR